MNAFAKLPGHCSKEFRKKKLLKPLKLIFKQAGKIRELQIELEQIEKYDTAQLLIKYRTFIAQQMKQEQCAFFSLIDDSFFKRLTKSVKSIRLYLPSVQKKKIMAFMEHERTKIAQLIGQDDYEVATLHKLRKQLKNYFYNLKIQDKLMVQESYAKMADILELLGEWHDSQLVVKRFEHAIFTASLPSSEIGQLENLSVRLSFEKDLLYREFKARLFIIKDSMSLT